MNKKKLSIIITVIVAVVVVVAVIGGISINKHNEQKREAQRQEEESKSKALAEELEQAKNDLLAYISDDTYVEDKTTYKDEIQSADNIDRINGIKADYEAESQEIKAEIERKAAEAEAKLAKLNKAKEDCKQYISGFSLIDQDSFNAQIDEATSEDELASIKESADEANKNAQEQMIKNSQSSTPSRRGFSITTTTGGPDTGSGSGSGTSGGGYTRNTDLSGLNLDNGDGNTELIHGEGDLYLK